ncbi:hypothetical protein Mapa_012674 [Marchantia paleacea]|nr:hypothetical protein Mapa_012674 [Marchantia paleacea]
MDKPCSAICELPSTDSSKANADKEGLNHLSDSGSTSGISLCPVTPQPPSLMHTPPPRVSWSALLFFPLRVFPYLPQPPHAFSQMQPFREKGGLLPIPVWCTQP